MSDHLLTEYLDFPKDYKALRIGPAKVIKHLDLKSQRLRQTAVSFLTVSLCCFVQLVRKYFFQMLTSQDMTLTRSLLLLLSSVWHCALIIHYAPSSPLSGRVLSLVFYKSKVKLERRKYLKCVPSYIHTCMCTVFSVSSLNVT